jgi:hypothetical protein
MGIGILFQGNEEETTKRNPKDVTSGSRPAVIDTVQLGFIIRSLFLEDIVAVSSTVGLLIMI